MSYQATTSQQDPTAVMGLRSLAWLVDAVLLLVVMLFFLPTPLSPLATEYENPNNVESPCTQLQDSDNVDYGTCLEIGDKAYVTEPAAAVLQLAVYLAYFLVVQVVWQGYTGMTPGKALLGLRTVGEDGQAPGMGAAFLRSILWIVDGIPGVPLVGGICAATSTGHRRIGDMAAKTYVVSKADAGKPIVVPGATPSYQTSPAYSGYGGTTAYPGQQTTTAWSGQTGQTAQTWGQQSTGAYPTQPPTAAEPQGYGTTPGYQQPASPYGGTQAQPASPYGTPAQPASPYGTPAQPASTDPASPYGTPAQPASPYGGTPAQAASADPASPYGTPAQPASTEPASPYGTPAQPASTDPASPYGGTPTQPASTEPAATEPAPAASEPAPTSDRPVTWPPVVPSPESIGMPGADESSSAAPVAETPSSEAPAEPTASEQPSSPWANLGGTFNQPTGVHAAPEPAASEPAPAEPPAAEPRSPASELADLLGSPGAEAQPEPSEPAAPAPAPETESGYKPQWDAARGAYIQWDPNRQSWLQWDDTSKEWKAI